MELHHRREQAAAFKRNMALTLSFIAGLAFLSSLQTSLYLHRNLEARDPHASLSSSVDAHSNKRVTIVSTNKNHRALLRKDKPLERSRAIDGSSSGTTAQPTKQLDFIIAGFPKTGTTSLLRAFADHPETAIASSEQCAVVNPMVSDNLAARRLEEALSELSASRHVKKRGIKCPNAAYHAYTSIVRFEQYAPNTKFVIGVRHPVDMLQSYYNYRITELYDQQKRKNANPTRLTERVPPLEDLIGVDKEWKGVSTDSARFDLFLMQFGKASIDARALHEMIIPNEADAAKRKLHHLAIKPNNFSIFIYTLDQLEDSGDAQRNAMFRNRLQQFLGLEEPLKPVGRENLNHFVGKKAHPETIDICDGKYKSVRKLLINQGKRSARWIEQEFIQSPDVVVANREHFLESLRSWSKDPCDEKRKKLATSITKRTLQDTRHLSKDAKKRVFVGRGRKNEVIPVTL